METVSGRDWSDAELLFLVTIVPGERPNYHLRNRLEGPKDVANGVTISENDYEFEVR